MDKKKKEDIQKKLKKCEEEKEEYLSGWKREKANFINYKNEESKRVDLLLKEKKKRIVLGIISAIDSFDRAEKEMEKKDNASFLEGFLKIKEQFEGVLKKEGVEKTESLGKEFDPFLHEVVEMVEEEGTESGIITEEIQKGYLMDGEVIRPAKVKVIK